jgi:hypothetical protein
MKLLIFCSVFTMIYPYHTLEDSPEIARVGESRGKGDIIYVHGVLQQQVLRIVNPCLVDT